MPPRNKNHKSKKYEAVLQALFQAEASGDKKLIRFWTDILLALEKRDSKLKDK